MNPNELLCIKHNELERSVLTAFKKLRDDQIMFDVTLGADNTKFQAHKVLLSACSDFFKEIFKDNSHPHTYVYLRGVDAQEMSLILDFIYEGEARIEHQRLDSFLRCANDLKIMGLSNNDENARENIQEESQVSTGMKLQSSQGQLPERSSLAKRTFEHLAGFPDNNSDAVSRQIKKFKKKRMQLMSSFLNGGGSESYSPTQPPYDDSIADSPNHIEIDLDSQIQVDCESELSDNNQEHISQYNIQNEFRLPSRLKSQSNRSWVWRYMGFKGDQSRRVSCKLCCKSLAYHNSTSSMITHLRRYHAQETMHEWSPVPVGHDMLDITCGSAASEFIEEELPVDSSLTGQGGQQPKEGSAMMKKEVEEIFDEEEVEPDSDPLHHRYQEHANDQDDEEITATKKATTVKINS